MLGSTMKRTPAKTWIALVSLTLACLLASPATGADLADKKALTLDVVKEIAAAAEKYADSRGWKVCITILDSGGHLLYFQRDDNVQLGSIEVAMRKARSAVIFRRPSKAFNDRVPDQPQVMMIPDVFALEGGVPIVHENQVLGAIGVSGVTNPQDGMIAQAGADALPEILGRR
jgi:uncharacterized protein GlcG (DUF336 family)